MVAQCQECEEESEEPEEEQACGGCETFEVVLGEKGDIMAVYLTVAAACPLVYAGVADQPLTLRGEILRYLREPALERTQRLALSPAPSSVNCSGPIKVRLSEEKPEVTFLDAIYLEVDGIRHDARACSDRADGADQVAYCQDDGVYTRLSRGATLDLIFDLKGVVDTASCQRVDLVADGFYMPL